MRFGWEKSACHRMQENQLLLLPSRQGAWRQRLSSGLVARTCCCLWSPSWVFDDDQQLDELQHRPCKQQSSSCKSLVNCGHKWHKRCRVPLKDEVVAFDWGRRLWSCWWCRSALASNPAVSACLGGGWHRGTHSAWSAEGNECGDALLLLGCCSRSNAGILHHCSRRRRRSSRSSSMPRALCTGRRISRSKAPLTMLVSAALTNRTPPWSQQQQEQQVSDLITPRNKIPWSIYQQKQQESGLSGGLRRGLLPPRGRGCIVKRDQITVFRGDLVL